MQARKFFFCYDKRANVKTKEKKIKKEIFNINNEYLLATCSYFSVKK